MAIEINNSVLCQTEGAGTVDSQNDEYRPWPYYSYSGELRPFPQSPMRTVPDTIARPDYADHPNGRSISEESFRGNTTIKVLNDEEIEAMKLSCKLGREVLDEAAKAIAIGVTTDEIDRVVHEASIERDCYPSPLNYYNFPKSCCTSVNEVICHGIPDARPLKVRIKLFGCAVWWKIPNFVLFIFLRFTGWRFMQC